MSQRSRGIVQEAGGIHKGRNSQEIFSKSGQAIALAPNAPTKKNGKEMLLKEGNWWHPGNKLDKSRISKCTELGASQGVGWLG